MSAEEELMGQDLDRVIRAALIASGQIVDSLSRKTQQKLQAAQQVASSAAQEQERAARDAARSEQDLAREDEHRRCDAEQAARE